jgi:RNA polymerase sigma factor (sigma-70 family)
VPYAGKIEPLTWGERLLAETFERDLMIFHAERAVRSRPWLVARNSWDDLFQEAWFAVCRAAQKWSAYKGASFRTFAGKAIYHRIWSYAQRSRRNIKAWYPMPHDGDEPMSSSLEDGRRDASELLTHWCSPDYAKRRRHLDVRSRVILYLRYVESWSLREVGDLFGISGSAVAHLCRRAEFIVNPDRLVFRDGLVKEKYRNARSH